MAVSTDSGLCSYIFDTNGNLVDLPVITSGSFTDVINGGSAEGSFTVPRRYVETGWVNYEYRVQIYLKDSVDPFYDGRVIDIDQDQMDNQDFEQISIRTEGWSSRLANAIVSEVLTPGGQANGLSLALQYGDGYLAHLISQYQDAATFGTAFVSSQAHVLLDNITFDGTELNSCIDTIVKQMTDNTGNTFEWFVRSQAGALPSVVVQPSQNPNKVATGYRVPGKLVNVGFTYEFKNSTIVGYKMSNSSRNLYNMIALYGGNDPATQRQVYGAYKDSTSISLYGLRQKKVTKSELISSRTLSNYAAVFLLLNGYPQPQGSFKKVIPSGALLAGQWLTIMESNIGTQNQNVHQVRVVKVTIDLSNDKVTQTVQISAPRAYIDNAYYGAINAARNAANIQVAGVNLINYFFAFGLDWIATIASPLAVTVTPPEGLFNSQVLVAMSAGPNAGNYNVSLTDAVTGSTGDGYYEVNFTNNSLTNYGIGASAPAIVCTNGVQPTNQAILKGWGFTVVGGVIVGARDLRIVGKVSAANIARTHYTVPTFASAPTAATPIDAVKGITDAITVTAPLNNVPQDNVVSRFAWFFKTALANPWTPWAETSFTLPSPAQSQTLSFTYGDLNNGATYWFGGAYVSAGGEVGDIATLVSAVATPGLAIQSSYLIGGANIPPTIASASASVQASANGFSAAISVTVQLSNQPINGSLSRIGFWVKTSGQLIALCQYYGSIPANSLSSPVATGTYTFVYADLIGGQRYDFLVSYEDAQGGETTQSTTAAISGVVATVISVAAQANAAMPAAYSTNGPTTDTANTFRSTPLGVGGGTYHVPVQYKFSDFTSWPPWFSGMRVFTRLAGDTTSAPMFKADLPVNQGNFSQYNTLVEGLSSGVGYDIGFAFIDAQNQISKIAFPSVLADAGTGSPGINPNVSIPTASNVNVVPDSGIKFPFQGTSLTGAYWNRNSVIWISIFEPTVPGFVLEVRPQVGSFAYSFSRAFVVANGQTYTISSYMDARTLSGPNPYCALYTGTTTGAVGTFMAGSSVSCPVGTNGRTSSTFTVPGAVGSGSTTVYFVYALNGTTINSSNFFAYEPQVEPGSAMGAYKQNELDNGTGYIAHGAMSLGVQSVVNYGGTYNAGTATGTLPYANHDGTIQNGAGKANAAIDSANLLIYGNNSADIRNTIRGGGGIDYSYGNNVNRMNYGNGSLALESVIDSAGRLGSDYYGLYRENTGNYTFASNRFGMWDNTQQTASPIDDSYTDNTNNVFKQQITSEFLAYYGSTGATCGSSLWSDTTVDGAEPVNGALTYVTADGNLVTFERIGSSYQARTQNQAYSAGFLNNSIQRRISSFAVYNGTRNEVSVYVASGNSAIFGSTGTTWFRSALTGNNKYFGLRFDGQMRLRKPPIFHSTGTPGIFMSKTLPTDISRVDSYNATTTYGSISGINGSNGAAVTSRTSTGYGGGGSGTGGGLNHPIAL